MRTIIIEKKNNIRLLKVKRNNNGSFSISKTWSLDDLKQIQIIDVNPNIYIYSCVAYIF